ncbi:MAG: ABC transporter, partial [candidate division NC10 bacterium]|nr:ABC transporter [candidate division NC10 bacterium]
MHARTHCSVVGFALAILISAIAPGPTEAAGIRIGSKNFTEQLILGELYGQALEARGIKVERKLNMGGTLIAHQALISNEIDMYPEYTGTALVNVVKAEVMTDAQAVYQKVKQYYEQQFKGTWLNQAPMNNTYVLAVPPETAAR